MKPTDRLLRTTSGRLQRARDAYRHEAEPPLSTAERWVLALIMAGCFTSVCALIALAAALVLHWARR